MIVKISTIDIAHKKPKFCWDSDDNVDRGDEVGDEDLVYEYVDHDNVDHDNVDQGNVDQDNVYQGNDNGNADHGDEVGDEDVVARVREVCSQLRWAELGHQQLKRSMGETIF